MDKSKNRLIFVTALAVMMAFIAMSGLFNGIIAFAETRTIKIYFKGHSDGMDNELLHKVTRLSEISEDSPSLTILVHGQGSDASHWSNNEEIIFNGEGKETNSYYFAKNEDSLIEKLNIHNNAINLYWAKFEGDRNFCLMNLNEMPDDYEKVYDSDKASFLTEIKDVSKHTIVVFQSYYSSSYHRDVYEELHTLIDKISYDFLYLTGKIPTVNLISHSRGGITSMMYATGYREGSKTDKVEYINNEDPQDIDYEQYFDIGDDMYEKKATYISDGAIIHDHPFNVAELYSMGTPYHGTDWDEKMFGISHSILGGSFSNPSAKNILDETIQNEIQNCWEEAVNKIRT